MAREMKDSGIAWIGEIPKEWEVVMVKNLMSITRGRVIPITEMDSSKPYPVYSSQTQNKGCMGYIDTYDLDGDALTWTTDGANAGTVFYRAGKYSCTNVCGILQKKENIKVSMNYLNYSIGHSAYYCRRLDINGYKIMSNEMATISIVLPSVSEQRLIANFLDEKCGEIDELVALQEKMIEELKAYKQSVITETVTKGLDKNVKMKDSGVDWIGEIPEHWESKRLKFVSNISRGLFNHRPRNDERYYGGEYPFIQTGDVARAVKYITTFSQTLSDLGVSVSKCFPKGTLTMTIAANVGDVSILDFDAYFPDSVLGIVPHTDMNNMFLYYVLKAMKTELVNNAIISTQLNLNVERVYNMFSTVPPLEEQHSIATYLDTKCSEIDTLISIKQKKIEELKDYKKSLIYEYVTGKKQVI